MSATRKPINRRERPELLIGLPEAAARCGVHYRTLRRWVAEGRIDAVRVGPRLIMIDPAELDKLVQPVGGNA
jgi:excisionase family DNA binding protein